MKPEIEPLEADVLSLLDAERPIADLAPSARASILAAVEARIGLPPLPGGDGGAGGGAPSGAGFAGARAIATIAATFAIGVATGVAVAPSVRASRPTPTFVEAPRVTLAEASPSAGVSPDGPMTVDSLPSAAPPTRTPTAPRGASAPVPSARGLGAERRLLDVARGSLGRGEAGEALLAVEDRMRATTPTERSWRSARRSRSRPSSRSGAATKPARVLFVLNSAFRGA